MKTHKDLDAWKQAIEFVTEIYKLTKDFSKEEIYGLTSQVRRAAVSIPSNIAEGAARATNKEFANFLSISLGSLAETETQLIIANNLNYIKGEDFSLLDEKLIHLRRLILGLRKYSLNH